MRILKLIIPLLIILSLAILIPDYLASAHVISNSGRNYTSGDYTIENNDWGKGSLIINKDYIQNISYDQDSLQRNVTMKWAYPDVQGSQYVYGYPEIIWGNKLGYLGTMEHSNQIKNITGLSVDYNVAINGDTENFSVGIEFWISNKPWGTQGAVTVSEVMIKVHGWQDGAGTLYSDSGLTAVLSHRQHALGHNFVALNTTSDKLSGTINLYRIINHLADAGIISREHYISGVELGVEMKQGNGSMKVKHFQVTETLAAR